MRQRTDRQRPEEDYRGCRPLPRAPFAPVTIHAATAAQLVQDERPAPSAA